MTIVYNVWLVDFELNQMSGYLKVFKTAIADYIQKLETMDPYYGHESHLSDEDKDLLYNAYFDEFSSMLGDFPRRLYSSFVISWYSFVEETLVKICDDLNQPIEKGKESLIKRLEKSFNKASYRFDPDQRQELLLINKIRNIIVHDGGKFLTSLKYDKETCKTTLIKIRHENEDYYVNMSPNLNKYMEEHDILAYYGTFFIKPSHEYCEHLVAFGRDMFEDIFNKLNLLDTTQ